ncbi:hypothetical protein EON65_13465 [archaeon]|nr:MAG: hypothetical protein EON65_13465 [archaeon]
MAKTTKSINIMQTVTTDQLTKQYIEGLQAAWQKAQEELERQREISALYERKLDEVNLQQQRLLQENQIQEKKLHVSDVFTLHPDDPFKVILEIAHLLPRHGSQSDFKALSLTAMIRIGESWVAINSSSSHYEEILFRSAKFDNYTRYKLSADDLHYSSYEQDGVGKIDNIYEILPDDVADFIFNGGVTTMTAEPYIYEHAQKETAKFSEALFVRTYSSNDDCRIVFIITEDNRDISTSSLTSSMRQLVLSPESTASSYSVESVSDLLDLLYPMQDTLEQAFDIVCTQAALLKQVLGYSVPILLSSVVNRFERRQGSIRSLRQQLVKDLHAHLYDASHMLRYDNQKKWKEVAEIICRKVKADIFSAQEDVVDCFEISAEILMTNFDVDQINRQQHNTVLLLSSSRSIHSIHVPAHHQASAVHDVLGLLHNSFEDAMHSAVRRSLLKHRPYAESYSKINTISKKSLRVASSKVYEHHAYLAVPLKSEEIMGVILVQIVYQKPMLLDLQGRAAEQSLACPYSADLLHIAAQMVYGDVTDLLLRYLKDTNYRAVNLFSVFEDNRLVREVRDVSVVDGLVRLLHDQTFLGNGEVYESHADDDSKSSASLELGDLDTLQDESRVSFVVDRMRVLLDSDWVSVLVTSSTVRADHAAQHFHHPSEVLLIDNDHRYHKLTWQKLSKPCRHIFYHLLHDQRQPDVVYSDVSCNLYNDKQMKFSLQDVIDLLQISHDLVPNLHLFNDLNIYKYQNNKIDQHANSNVCYANQVAVFKYMGADGQQLSAIICHGRMFRGPYSQLDYKPAMQLFAQAFNQHVLQRKLDGDQAKHALYSQEKQIMAIIDSLHDQLLNLVDCIPESIREVKAYRQEVLSTLTSFIVQMSRFDQDCGEIVKVDVVCRVIDAGQVVSNYLLDKTSFEWTYTGEGLEPSCGEQAVIYDKVEKLHTMSNNAGRHICVKVLLVIQKQRVSAGLLRLPHADTWRNMLSSYVDSSKSTLLLYPSCTRMAETIHLSLEQRLVQSLSDNILHGNHQLTHAMSHSFVRPYYHLHDYLHRGELLHSLSGYYPLHDFVILPITAYPGSKFDHNASKQSMAFKLLLQIHGNRKHSDEQLVNLPSKLTQGIHIMHNFIEKSLSAGEEDSNEGVPLTGYQAKVHQQFSQNILDASTYVTSSMSLLCEMPDMSNILCNYLYELNDHLQGDLFEMLLGKQHAKPSVNKARDLSLLETFIHPDSSKVMLYSPFYPASLDYARHSSAQTVKHLWTTHFLLISRPHTMITLDKVKCMQHILDEVYKPSHIIAAGQPWFECVKGIEQLLITATETQHNTDYDANEQINEYNSRFQSVLPPSIKQTDGILALDAHADKIDHITYHQVSNILAECLNIVKLSLSDIYMGSISYIMPPSHACILEVGGSGYYHELIQSHLDYNLGNYVHKRMKTAGNVSLGPRHVFAPAHSKAIGAVMREQHMQVTSYYNENHHLEHFEYGKAGHHVSKEQKQSSRPGTEKQVPQIHYIEMSMTQYQQQLHSNYNSHYSNTDSLPASNLSSDKTDWLLRDDVRVLQIYITAWFDSTDDSNDDELSAATQSTNASRSKTATVQTTMLTKLQHDKVIASLVVYLTPEAQHHSHTLKKIIGAGIWANIMRVVDITGVLVSSVYVHKRNKSSLQTSLKTKIDELDQDKEVLFSLFNKVYDLLHYHNKHSRHAAHSRHSIADISQVTDDHSTSTGYKDAYYLEKYQSVVDEVTQILSTAEDQTRMKPIQKLVNKLQENLHEYTCMKEKYSALQQDYHVLASDSAQLRDRKEFITNYLLILILFLKKVHSSAYSVSEDSVELERQFDVNLYSEEQVDSLINFSSIKKVMLDFADLTVNYKALLQMTVASHKHHDFLYYVQHRYEQHMHKLLDMHGQTSEDTHQLYLKVVAYLQDSNIYRPAEEDDTSDNDMINFNPTLHNQQDITKHIRMSIIWCNVETVEPAPRLEPSTTHHNKPRPFPMMKEPVEDMRPIERYSYAREGVLLHDALEESLRQDRIMHSEIAVPESETHPKHRSNKFETEPRTMHVYYKPISIASNTSLRAVVQIIVNPTDHMYMARKLPKHDIKSFMHDFFVSTVFKSHAALVEYVLRILSRQLACVESPHVSPWLLIEDTFTANKSEGHNDTSKSAATDSAVLRNISQSISQLLSADCTVFTAHNPEDFNELMYHFTTSEPTRHPNHILLQNTDKDDSVKYVAEDRAFSHGKSLSLSTKAMTRLQQILKQYSYNSTNILCAAYEYNLFQDQTQEEDSRISYGFPKSEVEQRLRYLYFTAVPIDPSSKEYVVIMCQLDRTPISEDVNLLSSMHHLISTFNTAHQQHRHIAHQNQNIHALSHSLATQSAVLQSAHQLASISHKVKEHLDSTLVVSFPVPSEVVSLHTLTKVYGDMKKNLFVALDYLNNQLPFTLSADMRVNIGVFSESTLCTIEELLDMSKQAVVSGKAVGLRDLQSVFISSHLSKKQIEGLSHHLYSKEGGDDIHNIFGALSFITSCTLVNDLYVTEGAENMFYLYIPMYTAYHNVYLDNIYYMYIAFSSIQERNAFIDKLQQPSAQDSKELAVIVDSLEKIRHYVNQYSNFVLPSSLSNYLSAFSDKLHTDLQSSYDQVFKKIAGVVDMVSKVLVADMNNHCSQDTATALSTNSISKMENVARLVSYAYFHPTEGAAEEGMVAVCNVQLHFCQAGIGSRGDVWHTVKHTLTSDNTSKNPVPEALPNKYAEVFNESDQCLYSYISQYFISNSRPSPYFDIVYSPLTDIKVSSLKVTMHSDSTGEVLVTVFIPLPRNCFLQLDLRIHQDHHATKHDDIVSRTVALLEFKQLDTLIARIESGEVLGSAHKAIECNLSQLLEYQIPCYSLFQELSATYSFNIQYLSVQIAYILSVVQQVTSEGTQLDNMLQTFQHNIYALYYTKLHDIAEEYRVHSIGLFVQNAGQDKADVIYHVDMHYNSITKEFDFINHAKSLGENALGGRGASATAPAMHTTSNLSAATLDSAQTPRSNVSALSPLTTNRTNRAAKMFTFDGLFSPARSVRVPASNVSVPGSQTSAMNNTAGNTHLNTMFNTQTQLNAGNSVFAYGYTRHDSNISIVNQSSENTIEIIFECHEIYGKITIAFSSYPAMLWGGEVAFWEHLARPLARRVFELYRGKKNKELMKTKSKELQKRNSELAEQGVRLESLEHVHSLTHQELTQLVTE